MIKENAREEYAMRESVEVKFSFLGEWKLFEMRFRLNFLGVDSDSILIRSTFGK